MQRFPVLTTIYVNGIRLRAHISAVVFVVMQFYNLAWGRQVSEKVLLLVTYVGLLE
jgi:hypothetical protein